MSSILSTAIKVEMTDVNQRRDRDTQPEGQLQSGMKLILLHERSLTKEQLRRIISVSTKVCYETSLFSSKSIEEMLQQFDVIVFDLTIPSELAYYDSCKASIPKNVTVVFLRAQGVHLDVEMTKAKLLCHYARKYLPEVFDSLADLIKKISSDHISSSVMRNVDGCGICQVVKAIIARKL